MDFLEEKEGVSQGFQIAPLIDIVFLMLIFFVTTSALETFEKDVSIDLPKSNVKSLAQGLKHTVYVEVGEDGSLKLHGNPVGSEVLSKKLTQLAHSNPEMKVVVRADKDVVWQNVVNAIEIITNAGITRIFYSIIDREE